MPIHTVLLDAGGVLVNPNCVRVSLGLAWHGVTVSIEALAAAGLYAGCDCTRVRSLSALVDSAPPLQPRVHRSRFAPRLKSTLHN